jgi:hypothetical protein
MIDAAQTITLLNIGMTELNPILNWLIIKTGTVNSIFIFKGFWLGFLLMFLIFKTKRNYKNEKIIWKFNNSNTSFRYVCNNWM